MIASIARRAWSPRWLAIADAAALVAFVLVGSASHGQGSPVGPLLRTGVPLLVSWFAVGAALGTYRRADLRTWILTWAVSVPAAAVVRSVVSDGPWDGSLLVFVAVSLAFTALFLILARLAVGVAPLRGPRSSRTTR